MKPALSNIGFLGYVGADLNSLVRESAIAAVNRMFSSLQGSTSPQLSQLLGIHLVLANQLIVMSCLLKLRNQ